MVTGEDEDDLKTAADKGKEVADMIQALLEPTSDTNASPESVTHHATMTIWILFECY